ncbi:MAG: ribosome maturation factor RimP [Acidimicrobiia bacterium]|nr:ribosome maturation factor RimP [Acidimicrobiia bacterium]
MSVQERVYELLEPIVATLEVELVDVEFTGGTLRVTVDQHDGITTESLAKVNRLISPILDQHDPVPGRYTLEVSSPGLERPLKSAPQYERAVGEQVVVKLVPSVEPRRVKGELIGLKVVEGGPAEIDLDVVEVDGVELDEPDRRRLALADIASARTVFEWGPSPKPGGPKQKNPKQKKTSSGKATATKQAPNNKSSVNREVRDEQ